MFFLPLCTPVLEPDFNLTFGEAQSMSNFNPSPSSEVSVCVKLFFQFQLLVTGVSLFASFPICNIFKVIFSVSLMINLFN